MTCYQAIKRKICSFCDSLLTGTAIVSGATTTIMTGLHYTGKVSDWKAVAIPSVITFLAIVAWILKSACNDGEMHEQKNTQTIIIQNTPTPPPPLLPVAQVRSDIELTDIKPGKMTLDMRIAPDGQLYTKGEFLDYYGDTIQWNQAPNRVPA